jgi:hypothetical protein
MRISRQHKRDRERSPRKFYAAMHDPDVVEFYSGISQRRIGRDAPRRDGRASPCADSHENVLDRRFGPAIRHLQPAFA